MPKCFILVIMPVLMDVILIKILERDALLTQFYEGHVQLSVEYIKKSQWSEMFMPKYSDVQQFICGRVTDKIWLIFAS